MKSLRRIFRWVPSGTTCLLIVFGIFGYLGFKMGTANMLNTLMNTAHDLLLNTVFYIMAICVITGAIGRIFVEFGVVKLLEKILRPFDVGVAERFKSWVFSKNAGHGQFTDEQMEWLRLVRDHIATSGSITSDDLDLSPFGERGGLGKFFVIFGNDYQQLLDDMNYALVA